LRVAYANTHVEQESISARADAPAPRDVSFSQADASAESYEFQITYDFPEITVNIAELDARN
jgi:hypothetical protein